jgi:hypothetical protein
LAFVLLASPGFSAASVAGNTPLAIDGLGPIKIGMTLAQVERLLGKTLEVSDAASGSEECEDAGPLPGLPDVTLMLSNKIVMRIDVFGEGKIRTAAGAGIGSSESEIKRLYRGVTVEPNFYDSSEHYMKVRSTDPKNSELLMLFDTDGRKVTAFRVGRASFVQLIEGCS